MRIHMIKASKEIKLILFYQSKKSKTIINENVIEKKMRSQQELQAIQQNLVDAVKSKNLPEVKRLIADTGINLNTNVSGFSAYDYIGRFADDSLRVLLEANSELDFNIRRYARGAAEAGHHAYAERLRTQCGANINHIAREAALGDQITYAEKLRTQCGANVNRIAYGACLLYTSPSPRD